jgi:hypothetical protein
MQYAILEQLRSPPPEFKDVIQDHFRCIARPTMLSKMACVSALVPGSVAGLLCCHWRFVRNYRLDTKNVHAEQHLVWQAAAGSCGADV